MAYDLIYRHRVPTNYARGEDLQPGPTTLSVGLLGALIFGCGAILFKKNRRHKEIQQYRQNYHDNLAATQETPAITTADLMFAPRSYE